MTRSQLQAHFAETGFQPSKKLGQNFLVDQNVARWIVEQLEIHPEDTVVEVGPGAGALTSYVRERCGRLILVEFDHRLAEMLSQRYQDDPDVEVVQMDACNFDTRELFPFAPVKLIGNLPYSAGGEIMRNFMGPQSPVSQAVLMLQKEVAARLCGVPRTKDFGVLTLRVQSRWRPRILKHIGPECFYPRPQVDSTVVLLNWRDMTDFPVFDTRLFDSVVRRGFSQRRKQLRKCLAMEAEEWEPIAAELGISDQARAEELGLETWVRLTCLLDDHPLKDNPQRQEELFDVVDAGNHIIDQKPRGEVHAQGLFHRAVHVFVFNKAGELFLQKRSRLKDVHPNLWDSSAAGHVNAGDNYIPTAKREVQEELGLEVDELSRIACISPNQENGWEFIELFEMHVEGKGKVRWPASEIEFGQYFPLATVAAWVEARPQDFAGGFLQCWAAYQAQCQQG